MGILMVDRTPYNIRAILRGYENSTELDEVDPVQEEGATHMYHRDSNKNTHSHTQNNEDVVESVM